MTELPKYMTLTLADGSVYGIPVEVIARNRAANYATEYDGNVDLSLAEDTRPLFASDQFEIVDWARNNMDWDDVKDHATLLVAPKPLDLSEAWGDAEFGIRKA